MAPKWNHPKHLGQTQHQHQKGYIRQEINEETQQDTLVARCCVHGPIFSVTSWKARRLYAELARVRDARRSNGPILPKMEVVSIAGDREPSRDTHGYSPTGFHRFQRKDVQRLPHLFCNICMIMAQYSSKHKLIQTICKWSLQWISMNIMWTYDLQMYRFVQNQKTHPSINSVIFTMTHLDAFKSQAIDGYPNNTKPLFHPNTSTGGWNKRIRIRYIIQGSPLLLPIINRVSII